MIYHVRAQRGKASQTLGFNLRRSCCSLKNKNPYIYSVKVCRIFTVVKKSRISPVAIKRELFQVVVLVLHFHKVGWA